MLSGPQSSPVPLSLHTCPKSKRKERKWIARDIVKFPFTRCHSNKTTTADTMQEMMHLVLTTQLGHQSPPNCFYSLSNLITILMRNHPDRSELRLTVTDRKIFRKVSRCLFAPQQSSSVQTKPTASNDPSDCGC